MKREKIDELKTVNASVRLKPTIYNFVMRAEGKSFNEKFNNLAEFCMTRELALKNLEDDYRDKLEQLQLQVEELDARIETGKELKMHLTLAYEAMQELYKPARKDINCPMRAKRDR